ncbi:MAG: nuclear transport factor 2 family protein [Symploca sp. SIO2E6]|nr:nuclear transport factor 2 family protein [Symploca sp. SIO2E6]
MTDIEKRNIEKTYYWAEAWNNDPMRMCDDCYAEDCKVYHMLGDVVQNNREELRKMEKWLYEEVDPTRNLTITAITAFGNRVATEVDISWRGGAKIAKGTIWLTFNDEGMIIQDNTYMLDHSKED